MTIIEFAQIKLLPGTTASTPLLKTNLQKVKEVIEAYNGGLPTNFFVEHDSPTTLYVIGSWATRSQHAAGFSGSPEQSSILGLIKDQMTITWQLYVNVDAQTIPLTAPVLTFAKFTLSGAGDRAAEKDAFREAFAQKRPEASASGTDSSAAKTVGGWNIPAEGDGDEETVWVQFTGLGSEDEARAFYASGEGERMVNEAVKGADVAVDMKMLRFFSLD